MKLYQLHEDDPEKIFKWLETKATNVTRENFSFKNGKIDYNDQLLYWDMKEKDASTKIEYPFGYVEHFFIAYYQKINTFENFPEEVDRLTLDPLPSLSSLKGIHQHVKKVKHFSINADYKVKSGLIDILKIEGLETIYVPGFANDEDGEKLDKAIKILNEYAGMGLRGVVKAQRDLIAADLDEFAD